MHTYSDLNAKFLRTRVYRNCAMSLSGTTSVWGCGSAAMGGFPCTRTIIHSFIQITLALSEGANSHAKHGHSGTWGLIQRQDMVPSVWAAVLTHEYAAHSSA